MERAIPHMVTRSFDNDHAKPVVVEQYLASTGWVRPERKIVLDFDAVEELHLQGVTLVRARWRLRTQEFSIFRLREERQPLQPHSGDSEPPR